MAENLCWHYAVSGALAYQEEAVSEALLGLWQACTRFDESKQVMQRRELRRIAEYHFWHLLFAGALPVFAADATYQNFWIWAVRRIRGSVIDLFRRERIITRLQGKEDGYRTLLYKDKFLSCDAVLKNDGEGARRYVEAFASPERADKGMDELEREQSIRAMLDASGLTDLEKWLIQRRYAEEGSISEIARESGNSGAWVCGAVKTALAKIRNVHAPAV